jgi:hypothetical protein
MRKSLYLAFVGVLALAMGCAMDSYPVLTDTEGNDTGFVVNTNGDVQYNDPSQVITLWPDQNEELFANMDQNINGGNPIRKINTHVNISVDGTYFLDYTLCNLVGSNCAAMTSTDDNGPYFDTYVIKNCEGARSVSLIVAYGGRDQECGNSLMLDAGLEAVSDITGAMLPGPTEGTYRMNISRRTTQIVGVDDFGNRYNVPILGVHQGIVDPRHGIMLRYAPNVAPSALAASRIADEYGVTKWELTHLGHSVSVNAKILDRLAERVRSY